MNTDRQMIPIGFGATSDGLGPGALGFKAYNLARMARLGLPVPQAFVLTTGWCRDYLQHPDGVPAHLRAALASGIGQLEEATGLAFGGTRKPLLVSVRSGAPVSMPGMMETILDIGLNDQSVRGLIRLTGNPRLAWDSYARLIQSYAEVVHGCPAARFEAIVAREAERRGVRARRELDFASQAAVVRESLDCFEELTGKPFPQDPKEQLDAAVLAVFRSWRSPKAVEYRRLNRLEDTLGTAVTVQRMVYGNAGGSSGAGVGFTRDPSTGGSGLFLDFRFNAQGEDVVSGRHEAGEAEMLRSVLPEVHRQIEQVAQALEGEFRDMQEFEFTVQDGSLHLLQTRSGKRTPLAALRIAVEQVAEGVVTIEEALERLAPVEIDKIRIARLELEPGARPLATAIAAGVGVATGPIALDVPSAQRRAAAGTPPILVREDIATDDIAGIAVSAGILTASGGRTSHAAVVARQLGRVCLVGCQALAIDLERRTCKLGAAALVEGDVITLDSETRAIYAGAVRVILERPSAYLAEVEGWQRKARNA